MDGRASELPQSDFYFRACLATKSRKFVTDTCHENSAGPCEVNQNPKIDAPRNSGSQKARDFVRLSETYAIEITVAYNRCR